MSKRTMSFLGAGLIAAAVVSPSSAVPAGGCGRAPGTWTASATAAWVRRVATAAGYRVGGCTGAAWVATRGRAEISIWATTANAKPASPYRRLRPRKALPRAAYTDGTRIDWTVRRTRIWVQAGPSATDALPTRAQLAGLQLASLRHPRGTRNPRRVSGVLGA